MFRPQLILLGGAMSEYAQDMIGPIRQMMERDCFGGEHGMIPEIAAAELGSSAGMIGAANL
jgi:glucokinase